MRNTADVTGGKPIAVLLQSISGVSAINPLVAFYDIHGGKREVLFFYFVPDTTRDWEENEMIKNNCYINATVCIKSSKSVQKDIFSNIDKQQTLIQFTF
jgi:hypothetical protein